MDSISQNIEKWKKNEKQSSIVRFEVFFMNNNAEN